VCAAASVVIAELRSGSSTQSDPEPADADRDIEKSESFRPSRITHTL
jgi:hypothetical protein